MSFCEEKPGKSMKKALIHLNIGFVVGILSVLLIYLVASQRSAASTPIADKQLNQGSAEKGKVVYNTKGYYSETCEVDGDVRINSTALTVSLVPTSWSEHREWRIRPYSRKTMPDVKMVTVTQLQDKAAAPACTVTYSVPAVLFALGGLTGNFWHDFTDVLVPLFIASRRYAGEVQFLITNMRPWYPVAYKTILQGLSKYDVVDLDDDAHVRCFPHVTVGIHQHRDLGIIPEWSPGGRLATPDFTRFVREVYALPRDAPASLVREPGRRPRLLLIHRGHSRRFMNRQEILRAAEAAGFEAVAMDLRRDVTVDEQARVVNSFDVLLGVHGAGLTNLLFLPPGAVLIQVVPYGKMDVIATLEFGEPAKEMGLRYLDYSVTAEESTLLEMLGSEHPAIKHPGAIHRSGWDKMTEFYLDKQSVRINIARFTATLTQAFDYLRQQ
ncbi:alpha-1,3-arabinosyltransferase XAT3-like [Panicum virgatum]|uniref:alpha-1,3-arabinosyltransferase XAT3-like n=1 Tax=Panicum virgatum TaxID=38727 RepID=UPI0019D555D5|nr:alpha-1,3-arabinosyltransferase XAT3-like [Panicum virgatum]